MVQTIGGGRLEGSRAAIVCTAGEARGAIVASSQGNPRPQLTSGGKGDVFWRKNGQTEVPLPAQLPDEEPPRQEGRPTGLGIGKKPYKIPPLA